MHGCFLPFRPFSMLLPRELIAEYLTDNEMNARFVTKKKIKRGSRFVSIKFHNLRLYHNTEIYSMHISCVEHKNFPKVFWEKKRVKQYQAKIKQ